MSRPEPTQVKFHKLSRLPQLHPALLRVLMFAMLAVPGLQANDAQKLLQRIRFSQTQGDIQLEGQLRTGNQRDAFQLTMNGDRIIYAFRTPPRSFQLRFGDSGTELTETTGTGSRDIKGRAREETLFNTEVSLADLCLDFLYWPDASIVGTDKIKGRSVDVLDILPSKGNSQYSRVRVWADQASGALMRIEAYNDLNQILKKLEVVEVQPWEGTWILRRMRIEAFDPSNDRVKARSYLEIEDQNRN